MAKKYKPNNIAPEVIHTAARVEDKVQDWLRKQANKRGWKHTVIAYDSYGTETFIRVLANRPQTCTRVFEGSGPLGPSRSMRRPRGCV